MKKFFVAFLFTVIASKANAKGFDWIIEVHDDTNKTFKTYEYSDTSKPFFISIAENEKTCMVTLEQLERHPKNFFTQVGFITCKPIINEEMTVFIATQGVASNVPGMDMPGSLLYQVGIVNVSTHLLYRIILKQKT